MVLAVSKQSDDFSVVDVDGFFKRMVEGTLKYIEDLIKLLKDTFFFLIILYLDIIDHNLQLILLNFPHGQLFIPFRNSLLLHPK